MVISMANDEQVAILKKGVKAWNAWREGRSLTRLTWHGSAQNQAHNREPFPVAV